MKDSLGVGAGPGVRPGAAIPPSRRKRSSGSGSRSLSGLKVSYDDPRLPRRRRVRSARLRRPPVRQAGLRHARIDCRGHARGPARVSQALVRRQQRHPRDRRRRHRRRRRSPARSARSAAGRASTCRSAQADRAAGADAPRRHRRSAGRRADRDPRRQHRAARASTRTTWRSTSRPRSSAAKGATGCTACCARSAASPTAPRPISNALKDTGDIVAETDTRSEKTGEALRLIVDEIAKLQRQRVQQRELQRRAGISDRQLSADHRDARARSRSRC